MDNVTVAIKTKKPYPVKIGIDMLNKCGELISAEIKPCRAAVISDENVMRLYGQPVRESLEEAGYRASSFAFPAGEKSKTPQTLFKMLDFLAENGFDRSDAVVALGGGVTGDLAGLAAALYMRGINFVQIPTSLLAMVDSSVGGKTAVNLEQGKNLAGVFKQPELVLCDVKALKSLSDGEFSCGMAEIIKYAVICDEELFDFLCGIDGRKALSQEALIKIITRCIEIKGGIVERDEFETGERRLLNFGHTIGHAIEKCCGYSISHGQAVGIGMTIMTDISEKLGFCQNGEKERLIKTLRNFDLPFETRLSADVLCDAVMSDKKRSGDKIVLVLPKQIGDCVCRSFCISEAEGLIRMGLEGCR